MDRYYSYSTFLKEFFGEKMYKICLNGGCTCPNRDGTLSNRGCAFCSSGGSGEFAGNAHDPIALQIEKGKRLTAGKYAGSRYIAYFQAYTGTYTTPERLRFLLSEAMRPEEIAAVAIGTRPDCLPDEILDVLAGAARKKPVFVEMGLQTCHDVTAKKLNRCYPTSVFTKAANRLARRHLRVCAHIILGLPGETHDMQLETIRYLNTLPVSGIKISMLYVLENTALGDLYKKNPFGLYSMEDYAEMVIDCLETLRKDIVVERLTGDAPGGLLIAPSWIPQKHRVLNRIGHRMKERDTWQGKLRLEE